MRSLDGIAKDNSYRGCSCDPAERRKGRRQPRLSLRLARSRCERSRIGQAELALKDLGHSIQLAPRASYPHLLKGEILSASAKLELAIQEYQHAARAPSATPQMEEFAGKRSKESAVKLAH
jgi:Tfp pilus assembly protein PilF